MHTPFSGDRQCHPSSLSQSRTHLVFSILVHTDTLGFLEERMGKTIRGHPEPQHGTHLSRLRAGWVHSHSHDLYHAQGERMLPSLAPCSQPALPVAFSCPAGLTYHRSKLDSIFQAQSGSSLRIPTSMRGVLLCIVWCHILKAEESVVTRMDHTGRAPPPTA